MTGALVEPVPDQRQLREAVFSTAAAGGGKKPATVEKYAALTANLAALTQYLPLRLSRSLVYSTMGEVVSH
jgi:hypothetical protein